MNRKYIAFIKELKQNIIQSRYAAARLVNKEQLVLYYITGKSLSEKIAAERWGNKVMEKIAVDLQNELPGLKGFSVSNLKNMRQFFEVYKSTSIGQLLTGQLQDGISQLPTGLIPSALNDLEINDVHAAFFSISFTQHILLVNKCKDLNERIFYIMQASSQFWTVAVLEHHIAANLFVNQGKLANNFKAALPSDLKTNALEVFKDEYLFDFINMGENDDERVFEGKIVSNIKNAIMALGKGFSFIGNQFRLEVDEQEFFIDLLFFNRHLQCLVAFELKSGKFRPEYAGQLNFYLNILDDKIKLPHENPSIGIILCKEKSNTIVEFAFKNIDKGMGAATFRTSKTIPDTMKGILPSANELSKLI